MKCNTPKLKSPPACVNNINPKTGNGKIFMMKKTYEVFDENKNFLGFAEKKDGIVSLRTDLPQVTPQSEIDKINFKS